CRIGTDLVVLRGDHKIPTCDDCLDALGLHVPDNEDHAVDVEGPVQDGDDHAVDVGQSNVDVGERVRVVRDLVQFAFDDSEVEWETRKELRRVARETAWLIDHQVGPFAGTWPGDDARRVAEVGVGGAGTDLIIRERAFTYDDIP